MCGHDHNHQHILKDDFHFIVDGSGGGRGPLGPRGARHMGISAASNQTLFYFMNCGFTSVEVTMTSLKYNMVDNLGRIHYTANIQNPFTDASRKFAGITSFHTSISAFSMLLLLLLVVTPVGIIGVYSYIKFKETSGIVQKDTAIDVSERSTTAFINNRSNSGDDAVSTTSNTTPTTLNP
jgi:hypothetical protein